MNIKWSKYIPHKPYPRQLAFLNLPHLEAFYGGAAGGGKSDALLMAALQYVDVPGYSGIIFRRTYQDMLLPSSVLSRAKEWLSPYLQTGEVKYTPSVNHMFTFPSGAKLAFGYLQTVGSEKRYQSSEYQYIAFDELTHFYEHEYQYLFSRLRRNGGNDVPLRMRAASNPGGNMRWVRDRFQIKLNPETGQYQGYNLEAPFVPAKMQDNPSINQEYAETLNKLGKVERERLRDGNWDITDQAIFEKHWFTNRWTIKNNLYYHLRTIDGLKAIPINDLYIFTTVDSAASVKTGVKGKSFIKNRPLASYSVVATWGLTPCHNLLLLDIQRGQWSIPDFVARIIENHKFWKPLYNIVEKNGPGEGVAQMLDRKHLPLKLIHSRQEKVINSIPAQLRAEKGLIWLPAHANWLTNFEDELFTWTGHPEELDDQVDVLSNAADEASKIAVGFEREAALRQGQKRSLPFANGGSISKPSRFHTKRVIENPYSRRPW